MEEKELLKKWIEGSISKDELEQFQETETFRSINAISEAANTFKAPEYNVEVELEKLQKHKADLNPTGINWFTTAWRVAALIVVAVGLYFLTQSEELTKVETVIGNKVEYQLPDGSIVHLNAESEIRLDEQNWDIKREIELKGEAYFKVEKGSTFSVISKQGKVTVLGTQFNVSDRKGQYEVICYEGKVQVEHANQNFILVENQSVRDFSGDIYNYTIDSGNAPSWISNRSSFSGAPLQFVLDELKRQYDISVVTSDVNLEERFTGSFPHDNLELAIQAISTPLSLNSKLQNSELILSGTK